MDIEGIRLFVHAAEALNISAAGRALGLAPAVASARLAKLEADLGATLLYRTTRKVSLSVEGAEFLPFAREMLAQEAAARAALGQGEMPVGGTLRVAASSTFAQAFIVPILGAFQARHPALTLDLRLSDKPFDLTGGSFDLALRNMALKDSTFRARKLADDQRILCASPDYLRQHGTPETPEDLQNHRLIAFGSLAPVPLRGPHGRDGCFEPKAHGRLIVDDGHAQKIAALSGLGICQSSVWAVHEELAAGRLVRVLPAHEVDAEMAIWLVYPSTHVVSPKVRVFMDFLIERIGPLDVFRC